MKRIIYTAIASMMTAIFISLSAFAMPYDINSDTSVNKVSALLPPSTKQSKVTESAKARGNFFARADLTVMNNSHGRVGALAVALFRFPIDQAYITIYLDRWDDAEERWRQVDYYEAEFYAKDFPDGLTTPVVDISFINQQRGKYYRLRGAFAAFYNGEYEGFTPTTDGVLVD